jgi:hypothetical protein
MSVLPSVAFAKAEHEGKSFSMKDWQERKRKVQLAIKNAKRKHYV